MNLSPARQRLTIASLLLLWSTTLLCYWLYLSGDGNSRDGLAAALIWNLFLATVPLFWSSAFKSAIENRHFLFSIVFFVLWLLFFPNAPYILTDVLHLTDHIYLGSRPPVPLWFLMVALLSCAGTGTLLGFLSLSDVHSTVEQRFGKAIGWMVVGLSLMLCGFGIYIGRYLRWNSWDAFKHPLRLLHATLGQFAAPTPHPHPVTFTLIFGFGLLLGYLAVRVIASPAPSQR